MIRIEVQQESDGERIAWEVDGPWDADVAYSLMVGIEETLESCDRLGVSLWDVMSRKASPQDLDFQLMSRPRFARCLTFQVRMKPALNGNTQPPAA